MERINRIAEKCILLATSCYVVSIMSWLMKNRGFPGQCCGDVFWWMGGY